MKSYRQVRVLIHPGRHSTTYSVVVRTTDGRHQHDHLVLRDTLDATSADAEPGALLRYLSDVLATAADLL